MAVLGDKQHLIVIVARWKLCS